MAKADIIAALGDGLYRIQVLRALLPVEQQVSRLQDLLEEKRDQIHALDEEIMAGQEALEQILGELNLVIQRGEDAGATILKVKEIRANLCATKNRRDLLCLSVAAMETKKDRLAELLEMKDIRDVWCADYSPALTGTLDTIEVIGQIDTILLAPGEKEAVLPPGYLFPAGAMSPAQAAFSWACFPGWQMWKPTYRQALVLDINNDGTLKCYLDPDVRSKAQALPVDNNHRMDSVPVSYMTCGADVFEAGDKVIVAFLGQKREAPMVIGFSEHPRPCVSPVIVRVLFHRCALYWDITRDDFADIPWERPLGWEQGDAWPQGWPRGRDYGPPAGWAQGMDWPYTRHLRRVLQYDDDGDQNYFEMSQGAKFWERAGNLQSSSAVTGDYSSEIRSMGSEGVSVWAISAPEEYTRPVDCNGMYCGRWVDGDWEETPLDCTIPDINHTRALTGAFIPDSSVSLSWVRTNRQRDCAVGKNLPTPLSATDTMTVYYEQRANLEINGQAVKTGVGFLLEKKMAITEHSLNGGTTRNVSVSRVGDWYKTVTPITLPAGYAGIYRDTYVTGSNTTNQLPASYQLAMAKGQKAVVCLEAFLLLNGLSGVPGHCTPHDADFYVHGEISEDVVWGPADMGIKTVFDRPVRNEHGEVVMIIPGAGVPQIPDTKEGILEGLVCSPWLKKHIKEMQDRQPPFGIYTAIVDRSTGQHFYYRGTPGFSAPTNSRGWRDHAQGYVWASSSEKIPPQEGFFSETKRHAAIPSATPGWWGGLSPQLYVYHPNIRKSCMFRVDMKARD